MLFTTWTQKGSNANGSLYVLDASGALLHQVPLPAGRAATDWNGAPGKVCTTEETETVANETIVNVTRTVEACERITAGPNLTLEEGADLTLRTGGTVELVAPVQVLDGARLTVVNEPPG